MANLNREDVYRSLLDHFVLNSGIPEKDIHVDYQPMQSIDGADWYEWVWEGWSPEPSRTSDHLFGRGSLRIVVRTRAQMNDNARFDISSPYGNAQTVVDTIEGQDVMIYDHASGDGTNVVGAAQYQEVQMDDLGEPADGVRSIICSTDFLLSAAQN